MTGHGGSRRSPTRAARQLGWAALLAGSLGCAARRAPPLALAATPPPPPPAAPLATIERAPDVPASPSPDRPWWAKLPFGAYRWPADDGRSWWLAVGHSDEHHHSAEGLLTAKVKARLALRQLEGAKNEEPRLLDLFITSTRQFYVLYGIEASAEAAIAPLPARTASASGRHLAGRHLFDDGQHLFLECDVEGPLANPNWGSDRVSAMLVLEKP